MCDGWWSAELASRRHPPRAGWRRGRDGVDQAGGPDDVEALRELERAAGEPFRALGMDAVADDEPPTAAELLRPLRAGAVRVVP